MILEIERLSKSFGGLMAIKGLDLSVMEGEIVGLIGPNGSGKSTLFNVISGLLKPDIGMIRFRGKDITGLKPHIVCRNGVARTFQLSKTFSHLTTLQNVMLGRAYGSRPMRHLRETVQECEEILGFMGLADKRGLPAGMLNHVDRKRLEIARALATRPKLLMLDEVMAGLNPAEMDEALALIQGVRESGMTLIIVEHAVKALLKISTKVVALSSGEKIAEGLPEDVVRNQRVIEAYLGEKRQHVWD